MPTRVYPLRDFYHVTICRQLHVGSCIKIWADTLEGFQSYGV